MSGYATNHAPSGETADAPCASAFPRAAAYRDPSGAPGRVRDPRPRHLADSISERHIQCVWYDPLWRPAGLRTQRGEPVEVIDPGVWNLEAGPDFLGAVLRVGTDARHVAGDVEVHLSAAGWAQHGHESDPRYNRVRCHVTYQPGIVPESKLPPGAIQVSLRDALRRDPTVALEAIDLAAYPYGVRATLPPCRDILAAWDAEARGRLLDAAGEERMRRKAERLRARIADVGEAQALYEELLTGLGFKHNKTAFRRLAYLVDIHTLRATAGGDPLVAYALLGGVSGLLPASPDRSWTRAAKQFYRAAWDAWWQMRDVWAPRTMPAGEWVLHNLRPANHPLRRFMAASALALQTPPIEDAWRRPDPESAAACLAKATGPFWPTHLGLRSRAHREPVALVGPDRVRAILSTTYLPYLAATGCPPSEVAALAGQLPREGDHQVLRQTAHNLFGPDHSPAVYRSGLRRQGIVQIFQDFCLVDRSRCETCPFPDLLRRFSANNTANT